MATSGSKSQPWLVLTSGRLAGRRHLVRENVTRIGRNSTNDVVIDEPIVSGYHLEIRKEGDAFTICDLNSTNGTFLNGEKITVASLAPFSTIQVGMAGPEFEFVLEDAHLSESVVIGEVPATLIAEAPEVRVKPTVGSGISIPRAHEGLLSAAILSARRARQRGVANETASIMREMLDRALRRTHLKLKTTIGVLVLVSLSSSTFGFWKIQSLKKEKRTIDTHIADMEALLRKAGLTEDETVQLADRLDRYESDGRALQSTLLYKISAQQSGDAVERDIMTLLSEFGAETYMVPPEFLEQVKRFIRRYQESDRPHMVAALTQSQKDVAAIRQILEEAHLPPDLVYVALVESAITTTNKSSAGAAGIWQFTPATAKAYGLNVGNGVDERLDVRRSTQAAARLLRDLILDFGAGSSIMLALAAYNAGTGKVKQGIKKVNDPIKQRNFWYLYRIRALPLETREYVPKVIAAMIIARHPARFGFHPVR